MLWSTTARGSSSTWATGSLGALQRYADIYDIDAVLLSHLHVDHCIDLTSYFVARKYHPTAPTAHSGLRPRGTADRMASAYGSSSRPGMHDEFNFMRHAADATAIGLFTVEMIRVAHPVETYAIRVSADGHRRWCTPVTPAPRGVSCRNFQGALDLWFSRPRSSMAA